MPAYTFERETRTASSESYVVEADGEAIGRLDVHLSNGTAYATLCVPVDYDDDAIEDLISEIDERLVMTWEPLRDDFIVTVWAGREVGVFSESGDEDEEEEDFDLDEENGSRRR
jgi:hypothetical protein